MKRYLVADDNGQDFEQLKTLIREHGYSAIELEQTGDDGNSDHEELLRANDTLLAIIESAPTAIIGLDLDGNVRGVWNPAAERMLGWSASEVMGRPLPSVPVENCGEFRQFMELMRSGRTINGVEVRHRKRDGSPIEYSIYASPLHDVEGRISGNIAVLADITERKRTEAALEMSRFILDKAAIGVMRGDADAKILSVNEYWAGVLGYTQEELRAMSFFDLDPSMTPELWRAHRERLTATGFDTFEASQRRKDGTIFPVEVTVSYLIYQEQEISCSFTRDISRRKEAEEALRKSEEKFRTLTETSAAAIVLYQGENIVYANSATTLMFGYTEQELLGMKFWDSVHPDFQETARSRGLARQRGEQVPDQYECKMIVKGGDEIWVLFSVGRIEYKGEPACIVTMIEITESKRWQDMISSSLAEKELLLKEIHHRVKNNLQIVSTLLDLQSESIKDAESLNAFRESQDRLAAMALIHERLYASRDFSSVDFSEYIGVLSEHLFASYRVDPDRITLKIDTGGVSIGIDRAIPCGLIINELVTNSLKHAFPDGRSGRISIRFHGDEDDWVTLTVADTGVGLPPGLDYRNTGTLGLQLVKMLADQLGGQVVVESNPGAMFSIRFWRRRSS